MPFHNPILPGFHPDPSFCAKGKDYYLVTSSFEYFPGVPIFHSRDLVSWKSIGYVLDRESQLELGSCKASSGIYAPTIRYHNGLFYMITTNEATGKNLIVYTEDPASAWSDPVYIDQDGIDPSLLFEDGTVYYTGASIVQGRLGVIMFEVNPMTGAMLTQPRIVWHGCGGRFPEAPHLYKIDGFYYLMLAEGGTEYGHMETIVRSRQPYGPYEECPHNPILSHRNVMNNPIAGTGHADILQAHDGSWWMTFLAFRPSEDFFHHLGRETFLSPIRWENGWPIVNDGKPIELYMTCDTLPRCDVPAQPRLDNFQSGIGSQWNYLRNPDMKNYQHEPCGLVLQGSECTLNDHASPTFIGRRQEHFNGYFETLLTPMEITEGAQIGLTVFYGPQNHYDFFLTKGFLCLRKRVGDIVAEVFRLPWQGAIRMKVTFDRTTYRFDYETPNNEWHTAGTALTRLVSTEVTPVSFTGVYLGLYAQNLCKGLFSYALYDAAESNDTMASE